MADAPSFNDLLLLGRAEQILNRPDLQVEEGDISDMLLRAAAAMADKTIEYAAQKAAAGFVDSATGADLTRLASDHWGLDRQAAVKSTGDITLSRSVLTNGAGIVPLNTEVATVINADGQDFRFVTLADAVFGALDTDVTVSIEAIDAGPDSNVSEDAVTRIVDNIFDSNISVSASTQMAGGANEESDADLRRRVREFPSTLRRGTLASLEFGAKEVDAVKVATAVEDLVTGSVILYVSDVDGNSSVQMIADVEEELLDWRCAGSAITVAGGVPFLQDVDYSLTVRAGTTVSNLVPLIEAAIQNEMNSLGIGDTLYRAKLHSAIIAVDPVNILNVDINNPSADITPAAGQLVRPGTITLS